MTRTFKFAQGLLLLLIFSMPSNAQTQSEQPIPKLQSIKERLETAYRKKKRITVTLKKATICIYPMNKITLERDTRIGGTIRWINDKEFRIKDSTLFDTESCQTSIDNVLSIQRNFGIKRAFKLTKEVLFCIITFGIPCGP